MGIDALTTDLDGHRIVPITEADWETWVSATATRNHALQDTLLDWLDRYGAHRGYERDDETDQYDERTDFARFIMAKGSEFENAVVDHLATLVPVRRVAAEESGSRGLDAAEETFAAMRRGEPIIWQAVLRDAASRTYGTADLLVRSDTLRDLFPGSITQEEASTSAPDLGAVAWHYRVVDVKFSTLHINADGSLSDTSGSVWAYKIQVYIYNRALGRLQGYTPPVAFLLGRGWTQRVKGRTARGSSCMDRLGAVPYDHIARTRGHLGTAADEACSWVRRMRGEGAQWEVSRQPLTPELRPNLSQTSDQPWHGTKQRIAEETEELTLLWQIGLGKREEANRAGLLRWSDPSCSAEALGIRGPKMGPTLDAIIEINRSAAGPSIKPKRMTVEQEEWKRQRPLEFYVDFETVSDLDDDFSRIPERGGQPLIFMIGCGHVESGEWRWSCFVTDEMTGRFEAETIDAWFDHMERTRRRLDPAGEEPYVYHWSHAERSTLETAFNSAKARHPYRSWPSPRWFDLLARVVKTEPLVVRGAFQFGLKSIAKAMFVHGAIETDWEAGPVDGLGAMVGAWSCAVEAKQRGCRLIDTKLMREIVRYNEVDCKVMMEIVRYLRTHH